MNQRGSRVFHRRTQPLAVFSIDHQCPFTDRIRDARGLAVDELILWCWRQCYCVAHAGGVLSHIWVWNILSSVGSLLRDNLMVLWTISTVCVDKMSDREARSLACFEHGRASVSTSQSLGHCNAISGQWQIFHPHPATSTRIWVGSAQAVDSVMGNWRKEITLPVWNLPVAKAPEVLVWFGLIIACRSAHQWTQNF